MQAMRTGFDRSYDEVLPSCLTPIAGVSYVRKWAKPVNHSITPLPFSVGWPPRGRATPPPLPVLQRRASSEKQKPRRTVSSHGDALECRHMGETGMCFSVEAKQFQMGFAATPRPMTQPTVSRGVRVSCQSESHMCRFPPLVWMASTKEWCFIVLLVFSTFLSCSGQNPANSSANSLNAVIRDYALRESIHLRTGWAYQVPLPANFSGMEASAMRLRIGSLWTRGANISGFSIPPRTLAVPFQRRLVLVYQNLGNWSASYYRVPGHSAVTPVLGLLAYGAPTNSSSPHGGVVQLDLRVTGDPISVRFAQVSLPRGTVSAARCAKFEPNGSVHLGEVGTSNVCSTRSPGHLAIVVPSPAPGPAPRTGATGRKRAWRVWLVACGAAAVVLAMVGFAGGGIFLLIENKRMEEMEGQAVVGEVLKTVWVGESRMPSATMVRTRPVLENGSAP